VVNGHQKDGGDTQQLCTPLGVLCRPVSELLNFHHFRLMAISLGEPGSDSSPPPVLVD